MLSDYQVFGSFSCPKFQLPQLIGANTESKLALSDHVPKYKLRVHSSWVFLFPVRLLDGRLSLPLQTFLKGFH